MEAIQQQASRLTSHDGISSNHTPRPRAASERASPRMGAQIRGQADCNSPSTLPKAFQSMLKTTTETGDIGMFSIKPSRVPHALSSPRSASGPYNENTPQPRQSFQPFGVPVIDDRRRLPSYARDATSEVISMYETASQKSSSRRYDDPDYRSYSMTQASSYSSYTLSNHRSYASLRSQQDTGALLRRPRSPFAYPTRLRRPGFRPSSPALTDGGIVDYSRRAEIDRIPNGSVHNTASPSSLYAQKRKPPLSLRNEANRSTPSLLSQPSPPRRSHSPKIRQSSGNSVVDHSRRNPSASVNTSPARSTFSLASTVNLYINPTPASTTTTPGKLHPPSPLYYDYTEDFDVDNDNHLELRAPPPAFRIERSIPEDVPSSERQTNTTRGDDGICLDRNLGTRARNSSLGVSISQKPIEGFLASEKATQEPCIPGAFPPHVDNETVDDESQLREAESKRDTKIIRLSGLGYGARELSTHVEEVFGLSSSPSFEVKIEDSDQPATTETPLSEQSIRGKVVHDINSARSSTCSLNTSLQRFPRPPHHQKSLSGSKQPLDEVHHEILEDIVQPMPSLGGHGQLGGDDGKPHRKPSIPENEKGPLLELTNITPVTFGCATHSEPSENSSYKKSSNSYDQPAVVPRNCLPVSTMNRDDPSQESPHTYPRVNHIANAINSSITLSPLQRIARFHTVAREGESVSMLDGLSAFNVPNFSHQIPRQTASRTESPILAPKPISPARQLKLKNSVPHLMKALPALPPDTHFRAGPPPTISSPFNQEASFQLSPLLESRVLSSEEVTNAKQTPRPQQSTRKVPTENTSDSKAVRPKESEHRSKVTSADHDSSAFNPAPRLKLKGKSTDSRPWNADESYPWSNHTSGFDLNTANPEEQPENQKPRFRLRVIRASNSTQGTIRVRRTSADSKPVAGLQLRNPKDLFTPSSGLDHIFRHVSQHIHSRLPHTHAHHARAGSSPSPTFNLFSNRMAQDKITSDDLLKSDDISQPQTHLGISEAQSSFSDDSSRMRGRQGVRSRLSNLKARLVVPYASRNTAHSYDDIHWDSRGESVEPLTGPALSSGPNLHAAGATSTGGSGPLRSLSQRVHAHGLRTKVRIWFQEAKLAISARVKSRTSLGRSDDEGARLTRSF